MMTQISFAQSARLKEARSLQAANKLDEALEILKDEINSNPEDGGAWFTYAEIQMAQFEVSQNKSNKTAALKEAMKGYENAKTYLDRTARMFAVASKRLSDTPVLLMDKGIQYYNEREFEQSVE